MSRKLFSFKNESVSAILQLLVARWIYLGKKDSGAHPVIHLKATIAWRY